MKRTLLKCDICGSMWDITDTDLVTYSYPGSEYVRRKIEEGSMKYILTVGNIRSDNRLYKDELDLCTGCYNKLDKFIFKLKEESELERSKSI